MKSLRSPQHRILTQALIKLRKERGITQVKLAEGLGVPQSYVAKVEGMERRLDVIEFVNWLEELGCLEDAEAILKQIKDEGLRG